jgi:hypothetical protein
MPTTLSFDDEAIVLEPLTSFDDGSLSESDMLEGATNEIRARSRRGIIREPRRRICFFFELNEQRSLNCAFHCKISHIEQVCVVTQNCFG